MVKPQTNEVAGMDTPYKIEVDLELIKKYDRPGPRYTSYPTAPHFQKDFTEDTYLREIDAASQKEPLSEVSLYFHFPFCRTLCYFCGCNVLITSKADRVQRYLAYLKKEIDLLSGLMRPDRKVVQLHWGAAPPIILRHNRSGIFSDRYATGSIFPRQRRSAVRLIPGR
jgi:oxygen-independent coproporphyrinogen III oxidase